MKIINIFSLGNIDMEYTQNMHMFLTHMVEKYPIYAKVARECSGYKILDNSLIELGGSVDIQRVLDAADLIGADEIILPDVFQNGPATIQSVKDALEYLYELYPNRNWPYKLQAVAQGKDEAEWAACYNTLYDMPDIDVIGIPKILAKMHPQGRPYFVRNYCRVGGSKKHHLLGLWYSFAELSQYSSIEKKYVIRSCDTVLASFFVINHMPLCSTRPDGFTVDLEHEVANFNHIEKEDMNYVE